MDKLIDMDGAFDGLRKPLEPIYSQTEDMVFLSKSLLLDWQQEREFQTEIEEMVIKNCLQSLQEEFEQRLWDQNAQSYGIESTNQLEKIKEISKLLWDLDIISKSLSAPESGHLISHGSLEHRKVSGSHAKVPSLWEGNGKHDESVIVVPENLDHSQLKHLSKDELFNHLKAEMTKMKRHYELKEHEMTEDYFSLKREYLKLKERPSALPVVKDKEFDTWRKKISEIILKLDGILMENEKLPSFSNNGDCLDNLKDRLESLCSENHQLKDLLMDKEKEIKCLSSQVSAAAEKIAEQSLAEENLLRMCNDLKCAMEDAEIEASISEDLYKFLLKEVVDQMQGFNQELDMEYEIIQGIYKIIFEEAVYNAEHTGTLEIEDSVIESIIAQGICEVIFKESFKEAEEKVGALNMKYLNEIEVRLSLEMQALEKEKFLRLNIAEKEKAEQEVLLLREMVDNKTNLVQEAMEALAKDEETFALASQELDKLRVQRTEQQILIANYDKELQAVKGDLLRAREKVEMDKEVIFELREQVETVTKKLGEVNEEKTMLLSISQKHQNSLSSVEAREREQRKQIKSTIVLVQGLSEAVTNFECRATEYIKINSLRLEELCSQLNSLIQKANALKREEFLYKQRLERRCSDLQKAEAEVDLLGDKVDTLLSLLEKIYIALDHYSPILKHYPGVRCFYSVDYTTELLRACAFFCSYN
ncbi:hypothetical protein JCGZ_09216 [Jatropha curcas]|uniref:WPP domain-associated protein n=1 Tax=Jatropha curcas TaxID=180498 RepID=A0A067KIT4_JATCU|nr:hypothetical protein JCGZ_09216 [Jatropha curcas]